MRGRETKIACGDEEDEKTSREEFTSRERKIGGDGKRESEKKRREEERGRRFSPPHAQMHLRERRQARGGQKVSSVPTL